MSYYMEQGVGNPDVLGWLGKAAGTVVDVAGAIVGPRAPTTTTPSGPALDLSKLIKLPTVNVASAPVEVKIPPMLLWGVAAAAGLVAFTMIKRRRA